MTYTKKAPIVFLSYTWDSSAHIDWVIKFAEKLISNGIEVILDKFELRLGNDFLYFMEQAVENSDKTILILTPNYKKKADKREGGIGYEYSLISNKIYKSNIKNNKFIPILKEGNCNISIPCFFESKIFHDFRNDKENDYDDIIREIYDIPKYQKPLIGSAPNFIVKHEKNSNEFNKIIGRRKEIEYLIELLDSSFKTIIVEGMGGIGKTTLIENLILDKRINKNFEKSIWINAKSLNLDYSNLLDEIAYSIDYPFISQFDVLQKKIAITKVLKYNSYLIIIDNFDTINSESQKETIEFLNTLPLLSKTIITSRPSYYKNNIIENTYIYLLNGLNNKDSLLLLKKTCNELNIPFQENNTIFTRINEILKGNPFLIKLIISELKNGANSLEKLYENIKIGQNNLLILLFENNWQKVSTNSKTILKICSQFYYGSSKEALNFISNSLNIKNLEAVLQELTTFGLIESNNSIFENDLRFDIHPLTKAFCNSKIVENKDQLINEVINFFLHFTDSNAINFWEGREYYKPIDVERINIFALMEWCEENNKKKDYVKLFKNVLDYLIVKGFWNICQKNGKKAIQFALELNDNLSVANFLLRSQGYIYTNIGNYNGGEKNLKLSLKYFHVEKYSLGEAEAYRNLGRNYRKNRKYVLALKAYNSSLLLAKKSKNKKLQSLILNELGKLKRDQEKFKLSMEYFQKALKVLDLQDNSISAGILCNLSGVAISVNDLQLAEKCCIESLNFFDKIANLEGIASAKWRLAQIQFSKNKKLDSLKTANDAIQIFSKLGMFSEIEKIEKYKKINLI